MQAEGLVIRCEASEAVVQVRRSGGCGRCNEPGGCGGAEAERCSEYLVANPLGARPGERVLIELPEGAALRAAGLAYVLPLAGLLLGALAGLWLGGSDLLSVSGAVCGLAAAWGLMRFLGRSHAQRPHISGVLS